MSHVVRPRSGTARARTHLTSLCDRVRVPTAVRPSPSPDRGATESESRPRCDRVPAESAAVSVSAAVSAAVSMGECGRRSAVPCIPLLFFGKSSF